MGLWKERKEHEKNEERNYIERKKEHDGFMKRKNIRKKTKKEEKNKVKMFSLYSSSLRKFINQTLLVHWWNILIS